MDTMDHTQLATDSLWATLRTLSVMQEYQKHGIENHPAISAAYVRFLVSHSGQGEIAKFKKELGSLSSKLDTVKAAAKAAQCASSTAVNAANEAKKAAAKK